MNYREDISADLAKVKFYFRYVVFNFDTTQPNSFSVGVHKNDVLQVHDVINVNVNVRPAKLVLAENHA